MPLAVIPAMTKPTFINITEYNAIVRQLNPIARSRLKQNTLQLITVLFNCSAFSPFNLQLCFALSNICFVRLISVKITLKHKKWAKESDDKQQKSISMFRAGH